MYGGGVYVYMYVCMVAGCFTLRRLRVFLWSALKIPSTSRVATATCQLNRWKAAEPGHHATQQSTRPHWHVERHAKRSPCLSWLFNWFLFIFVCGYPSGKTKNSAPDTVPLSFFSENRDYLLSRWLNYPQCLEIIDLSLWFRIPAF